MSLNIRPARQSEQSEIKRLIKQFNLNPMKLNWQNFLVGEEAGKIVAIGQVKTHGKDVRELASIAVIPEKHGQGLGSEIIQALLAKETGTVYLTCASHLEKYYTRFGFRAIGLKEMPAYFRRLSRFFNAIIWMFSLFRRQKVRLLVMQKDS
jgi:N-acetylglutamate synthase-like GNAT family acetyltransferase